MKQTWPAPERNKDPILDVLREILPAQGLVLEISSGSGQHAVHFARALPALTFQPTDFDPDNLASIEAWVDDERLPNLRPPLLLDVLMPEWPLTQADVVFNANMIHIAPWACCEALMAGAGRLLSPGGLLVMYGPYRIDGAHTADSNAAFDAKLRAQNPAWGVRNLEDVVAVAERHGLALVQRVAMPANNQTLVFRR